MSDDANHKAAANPSGTAVPQNKTEGRRFQIVHSRPGALCVKPGNRFNQLMVNFLQAWTRATKRQVETLSMRAWPDVRQDGENEVVPGW